MAVGGRDGAGLVEGDAVGPTLYYGAGAGAEPTASAVVADLVDLARELAAVRQRDDKQQRSQPRITRLAGS